MTCRDFERMWNELLDAETGVGRGSAERGHDSLKSGRAGASLVAARERMRRACAVMNERYHLLRRAIRGWGLPPAPSAGLADRILVEIQAPTKTAWAVYGSSRRERLSPALAGLAATIAAGILLAIVLPTLNRSLQRGQPHGQQVAFDNTHARSQTRHSDGRGGCAGLEFGPG